MKGVLIDKHFYNIDKYKSISDYRDTSESFFESFSKRGVRRLFLGDSLQIDFFTTGLSSYEEKVLVCFSGAVTERKNKNAPFFSGAGVASQTKMPLISISDPSLAINRNTSLGWYAGHEGLENLPKLLSSILDKISIYFNARLLLVGGSGGGFAALNIGSLMLTKPDVLVWGPQTSISEYSSWAVKNYINNSFPKFCEVERVRYDFLDEVGLKHDVTDIDLESFNSLFYLQNITDMHSKKHAGPFLSKRKISPMSNGLFRFNGSGRHFIFFGDWGSGHIPPPKNVIIDFVKSIKKESGLKYLELTKFADGFLKNLVSNKVVILSNGDLDNFDFQMEVAVGGFNCEFFAVENIYSYISFAFYIVKGGLVVKKIPYSKSSEFFLESEFVGLDVKIVVYVKDLSGNVLKKKYPLGGWLRNEMVK